MTILIAAGDLNYGTSADCWFKIISQFKSKLNVSREHEYDETTGGIQGVYEKYLKPLNIQRTYYSFYVNKVHIIAMDQFMDSVTDSDQYPFIESDLKKSVSIKKYIGYVLWNVYNCIDHLLNTFLI